jgi:hypothetical protein
VTAKVAGTKVEQVHAAAGRAFARLEALEVQAIVDRLGISVAPLYVDAAHGTSDNGHEGHGPRLSGAKGA